MLLGNGGGTFQTASNFATGLFPFSVAIGDLNGDGKLDLVFANRDSNDLSALLGDGLPSIIRDRFHRSGAVTVG